MKEFELRIYWNKKENRMDASFHAESITSVDILHAIGYIELQKKALIEAAEDETMLYSIKRPTEEEK